MTILNHTKSRPYRLYAVILLSLSGLTTTQAKDYKVEVVVFENTTPHAAYESTHYQAIEELTSDAVVWDIEPSMLLEEVTAIDASEDYQFIAHYSWGQEALPTSEAAIFDVIETNLQGWVKVYASHLLFANLDLDFNGYRMNEKRRLKLNEKHFFDHPKFGVLLQVSRLEPNPDEDLEAEMGVGAETEAGIDSE